MASHNLLFELFYDGAWHAAPVYARDGCTVKRGTDTPGSESDPASATLTLDNRLGLYSPRSVVSPLYGKIGQNTKARLTVDGSVRLVGEVVSWRPERAIKGDAWTKIQVAGVLQRIGRGTDPLQSAVRRSIESDSPVAYWPLTDGRDATQAASALSGGTPMTVDDKGLGFGVAFGTVEGPIKGESFPQFIQSGAYSGELVGTVPTVAGATLWQFEGWFNCLTSLVTGIDGLPFEFSVPGSTAFAKVRIILQGEGRVTVYFLDAFDVIILAQPTSLGLAVTDGEWHSVRVVVTQTAPTVWSSLAYFNGSLFRTDTGLSGTIGFPAVVRTTGYWDPFGITIPEALSTGHIAVCTVDADHYEAGYGYPGELAADRFVRLCTEQDITPTVYGSSAESVSMGPQLPLTLLGEFDEIARTDDASIFETRTDVGLTMRTGVSKLNQAPAFTISYLGQIRPGLSPVYGDEGIRNDVTASSPGGTTGRVQQLTGPHNVQLPEDDPQGVGRYQTRIDVNPATNDALSDAAGWRVNLGTYDGTWYAAITADLDAAPAIAASVAALDIGDVLAISQLPVDEALDTVESIIIGIEEEVLPKRRLVKFYCVPAEPYRVGISALTSGDTDPFLGHLDTDGSTTSGATLAGATTFSVATPSGPLWTTVADDFPFDVIVGGQRISISSISGASSPQTFTVQASGRRIVYPIPAGSAVNVQQPVILAM